MSLGRSGIPLLLGLAALAAAGRASADPPPLKPLATTAAEPRKRAVELHDEAWALYEQGRYRAAVERLEAALRLDPEGREIVYNLAVVHEKLGDLKEAATYYRRFADMEPDPKAKARAQTILRRLEGAEREAAERPTAPAPPPPSPRLLPRPVRPWVVATGGVAGAALVVGAVFGFRALAKNPGDGARTGDGVTIDDLEADAHTAHSYAIVADAAFVISAAAAGAALILYFSTPRPRLSAGPTAPPSPPSAFAPQGRHLALAPGRIRVDF